ncbi:MAG: hypothetical protein HPY66_1850 [Firmicutes bacterium]|nr:hypothetical protein [Bacillota bacterium]
MANQARKETNIIQDYSSIRLPSDLIETVKKKLGDEFLWNYDPETKELFIIKRPPSITEALYGLGADMWKKAGGTDYIRQERDSWAD